MKKLSKSNGHYETSYGNSTEDMHDLHKTRDGIADTLDLPGVLFSDTGSVYSIETKIDHKTSTTHGLKKKGHHWTILTPTIPTKAMSGNENLEVIDNFRVVKFRSWDSALSNDCISSSYDRSISCDTGDLDNICDISSSVTEDDLEDIFAISPFVRVFDRDTEYKIERKIGVLVSTLEQLLMLWRDGLKSLNLEIRGMCK
ncbi:hypothetical protein ACHAXA_011821 [Cyclostephanos tholiformis]